MLVIGRSYVVSIQVEGGTTKLTEEITEYSVEMEPDGVTGRKFPRDKNRCVEDRIMEFIHITKENL